MARKPEPFDLKQHHDARLAGLIAAMPFVLRLTEWKDRPIPVLVIKERQFRDPDQASRGADGERAPARALLIDRGSLAGEPLHRCLPILRRLLEGVKNKGGVPLELQRYLTTEGLRWRGNLPLDEEAGAKLALIFRLQDRLKELDRVELIAHRVGRFTREEAAYWLSRTTSFGPTANRWALSGLRILLGGQAGDPAVATMLADLRLT